MYEQPKLETFNRSQLNREELENQESGLEENIIKTHKENERLEHVVKEEHNHWIEQEEDNLNDEHNASTPKLNNPGSADFYNPRGNSEINSAYHSGMERKNKRANNVHNYHSGSNNNMYK